jgi:hypothetical protein
MKNNFWNGLLRFNHGPVVVEFSTKYISISPLQLKVFLQYKRIIFYQILYIPLSSYAQDKKTRQDLTASSR